MQNRRKYKLKQFIMQITNRILDLQIPIDERDQEFDLTPLNVLTF